MIEQTPQSSQERIAQLEQQLKEARAARGQSAEGEYERAEVHAAVGEQILQAIPSDIPVVVGSNRVATGSDIPSWQDPALAGQVQQLVNVAFTQSVQAAIAQAVASKNPALIDAFHDILTDHLHDELLQRHKVEAIS